MPGAMMLNIGTLDDRRWVKPVSQIYCDSAQSWALLGGEMPRFAKLPGSGGGSRRTPHAGGPA